MPVTLRHSGSGDNSGASFNGAWTWPYTPIPGNLLVVVATQSGGGSFAMSPPAGWSTAVNAGATAQRAAIFWKIADGTETTDTIGSIVGSDRYWFTELIAGHGKRWPANPVESTSGPAAGSGTGYTLAALTHSNDGYAALAHAPFTSSATGATLGGSWDDTDPFGYNAARVAAGQFVSGAGTIPATNVSWPLSTGYSGVAAVFVTEDITWSTILEDDFVDTALTALDAHTIPTRPGSEVWDYASGTWQINPSGTLELASASNHASPQVEVGNGNRRIQTVGLLKRGASAAHWGPGISLRSDGQGDTNDSLTVQWNGEFSAPDMRIADGTATYLTDGYCDLDTTSVLDGYTRPVDGDTVGVAVVWFEDLEVVQMELDPDNTGTWYVVGQVELSGSTLTNHGSGATTAVFGGLYDNNRTQETEFTQFRVQEEDTGGGPANVVPTEPFTALVTEVVQVTAEAQITPTGPFTVLISDVGQVNATAQIAPVEPFSTLITDVVQVTSEAQITPVGPFTVVITDVGQVTATANVVPVEPFTTLIADIGQVSQVTSIAPVEPFTTLIADVGQVTATADVVPVEPFTVLIADIGQVASTVLITPTEPSSQLITDVGQVTATANVVPVAPFTVVTADVVPVTASALIEGVSPFTVLVADIGIVYQTEVVVQTERRTRELNGERLTRELTGARSTREQ